ncbi:MAG: hypothetical protein JWP88_2294 [Flaviaesturariibacter sp.]|nr:hypothetical protein [Flaviaesturariibacter sp.]
MKTIKGILFFACVISYFDYANAQKPAPSIKAQALYMATALMKNDFNTFVKYMHPNIIAYAGGASLMKTKMDSASLTMKRFGVQFKKYWIGNPGEIIRHKNQLQTLLPQQTTLLTPMGELAVESTLVAISPDNGKNWWFIDTSVYKTDKLKRILPDLNPRLVIPPPKKPKLVPKVD